MTSFLIFTLKFVNTSVGFAFNKSHVLSTLFAFFSLAWFVVLLNILVILIYLCKYVRMFGMKFFISLHSGRHLVYLFCLSFSSCSLFYYFSLSLSFSYEQVLFNLTFSFGLYLIPVSLCCFRPRMRRSQQKK